MILICFVIFGVNTLSGWRICRIGGISIEINASWLVVFALVFYDLAHNAFGQQIHQGPAWLPWVAAFITALLFFSSVLLHELAHSFMARRVGIGVTRISLFIFGGVAQVDEEPQKATDELIISLAGPLTSILLGVIFGGGYLLAQHFSIPVVIQMIFQRVAVANIILAVFNMIPGFPLDGGRVLRALLWHLWGDPVRATRVASMGGQIVGYLLMTLGIAIGLLTKSLLIAVFYVAMGLLLASVARASYQRELVKARLKGMTIGQAAHPPLVSVMLGTPLGQVARMCLIQRYTGLLVVTDGQQPVGYLACDQFSHLPDTEWYVIPVEHLMQPLNREIVIRDRRSLTEAVQQMQASGIDWLLVIDDWGNLRGVADMASIENEIRA